MRIDVGTGTTVYVARRNDQVTLELEEAGLRQEVVTVSAEMAYTVAMAILKERRAILSDRKSLSPTS